MKTIKNIFKNWEFVWRETLKNEKLFLLYSLAGVFLEIGGAVLSVYFPAIVVGSIEEGSDSKNLISKIILIVILLIVITVSKNKVNVKCAVMQESSRMYFINLLNDKIMRCSYNWTENAKNQVKISQATDFLYTSRPDVAINGMHHSTKKLVSMVLGMIMYIAILKEMNAMLIVLMLVISIVNICIDNKRVKYVRDNRNDCAILDKKINYINEKVTKSEFSKDIRIFHCADWILNKLKKIIDERAKKYKKLLIKDYVCSTVKQAIDFVRNLVILVYVLYLECTHVIMKAEFVLYVGAIMQLFDYVTSGMNSLSVIKSASDEVDIIKGVLESDNQEKRRELELTNAAPEIIFSNVSFKYEGADEYIIKKFSLAIRSGEKIALVGKNGSGKTTLVKLLCGFYEPQEGTILIDGKNISEYTKKSLQKYFSVVFQDKLLLPFSLEENIALVKSEDIDRDKLECCIKFSGLKKQIDRPLIKEANEEGIDLSGGEVQKLLLARALYKDAPILILDEPTAALDAMAEESVYRQYHSMSSEKTSIFISHRLASTLFCDRIILLENGQIAENGTHQELIELKGKYTAMFNEQRKYYIEEKV